MPRKAFLLRIELKVWNEIAKWAQDELRSVNGQIEYLLKEAVEKRKRADRADPDRPGSRDRT